MEALFRPTGRSPLALGRNIFGARSQAIDRLEGYIPPSKEMRQSVAISYLHMFANRLFRASHRAQETVLYDFLHRLYLSQDRLAKPTARCCSIKRNNGVTP